MQISFVFQKKSALSFFLLPLVMSLGQPGTATAAWQKIIDNGETGYSETGEAWRSYENGDAYGGNYRYLSDYDQGLARSGTATWMTTIPADGRYQVAVSFRRTENRTSEANYFVTNSQGGRDEYAVNQSGTSKLVWKTLGEYSYTAGQSVSVVLDGTDDNYSDCADAVSWTRVPDPGVLSSFVQILLSQERNALVVAKEGDGNGIVSSSSGGIDCGTRCSRRFRLDETVELMATEDRGSNFSGWKGSCSGTGICRVGMDQPRQVSATFTAFLEKSDLSVTISGSGTVATGLVSADGSVLSCSSGTCTKPYYKGDKVTLTATPATGYSFSSWSGACSGTATTSTVTMAGKDIACSAKFTSASYTLEVKNVGVLKGYGNVTSSPSGISCVGSADNSTSCKAQFNAGSTVTLTATAIGGNFGGWSGDCEETDDSHVAEVAMNGAKSCSAYFYDL